MPFPYSDLTASKRRPVLIISNNDYNRKFHDVVVCVITSNQFKDSYSIELENENLEMGVLPESLIVKVHKLFTIHQSKIIKKFSLVKTEYFKQIVKKINDLIKN